MVTIHDLIYHVVPEARAGLRARGMRVLLPLAARRANRIIVDADATRSDLRQLIGVPADRIDVVPLGFGAPRVAPVPEAEVRRRIDVDRRPILLSVSAKLPHKNLPRLISALATIAPAERPVLVLPGYPTPHEAELRRRAEELGISADVRLLGWVSPEELEGLYAAAAGFIFPSLYEGFGLPVLEAMVRGVPVACSGRGSLLEVAGEAALLFEPDSEPAIAQAIQRLIGDRSEAGRLVAAGRAQAARFSWEATAAGTLAAYERALAG